ncbi:MAG: GNAT family N-acetyltransferase [Planctomycetes bacterium]|nr:GNAT family N-acetyltransferase [Planctomycetota bacterium]
MDIRQVEPADLPHLLELYTHLHGNALPPFNNKLASLWNKILDDDNHHIIVGIENGAIISSCVLVIIPNLTHYQRPYALIENVITREDCRQRGYASRLLEYARQIAIQQHCYKIMLMTSSKDESTWRFYENAGYNRHDKTAFIQWLEECTE